MNIEDYSTLNLGQKIDLIYNLREKRKKLEETIKNLRATEEAVSSDVIESMRAEGVRASKGEYASFSYKEETYPIVESWPEFYKYIVESGDFDLLQRRIGSTAWKERLEDGIGIPGVGSYTKDVVYLRKG